MHKAVKKLRKLKDQLDKLEENTGLKEQYS